MERLDFLWLSVFFVPGKYSYHPVSSEMLWFSLGCFTCVRKKTAKNSCSGDRRAEGGQKLYRKVKQTGHREREQNQECQKKGVEENEEKQQKKWRCNCRTFLYLWHCYMLTEKSSFGIPQKIPHLCKVSENIGFAFMALKQGVLLVPGLKAASTFDLQWGKGASPHSNFLRSKRPILGKAQTSLSSKNDTLTTSKTGCGDLYFWRKWGMQLVC